MSQSTTLTLETLMSAVAGDAVAVRAVNRLYPAGGPGDKVFPPTYTIDDKNVKTRYATELRIIRDGDAVYQVKTVLLDSVQSQANRMEQALLGAWKRGDLVLPVVQVDFSSEPDLRDLGAITSLDAPHRLADALLRDSLLDGVPFRMSGPGSSFTDAKPKHSTPLYVLCPTALVFGMWDSTGPKGGAGTKFARAITSEIVGWSAEAGVKTSSRIDPAAIQKLGADRAIYKHKDPEQGWTLDAAEAERDAKGPVKVGKTGKPSEVNHGNIAPSLDRESGGVTIDYATQTAVLSLVALRRLGFPSGPGGEAFTGAEQGRAELAARTALAALGVAALVLLAQEGHDLRSRCLLVPDGPLVLELVSPHGEAPRRVTLTPAQAVELVNAAASQAAAAGLPWDKAPLTLKPSPKLSGLIRESRKQAMQGAAEAEA